ncbi:MAG: hypothetical protein E7426_07855 [Ruminococcaceae bacterium]|nr:hypothetical protein [Oscillospiraceae bacterium]
MTETGLDRSAVRETGDTARTTLPENDLQPGDTLRGFTVRSCRALPEISTRLVEMEYEKNGARLLWLDREDENMSFAIGFRTLPTDDTGVFHILEHSVLNGSEKYPVKEPFVNLLQSSLQTFLNAMTYPDKTVYPVASRNRRDFHNLVDVYMDAVLHPLIYRREETFRQEGWHYEWDEDGRLICNGVVYNEMKGDYGSVETQMDFRMGQLLLPDTCYRYDSGGHPDSIPELTYEQFLDTHRRFYHPSNAYIVLDGSVDLDDMLALLDGYLCGYDRRPIDLDEPAQPTLSPAAAEEYYETDRETEERDLCYFARGWICGGYAEKEKAAALRVLSDVLCGSNESPLKKAVVESGLAENIDFSASDESSRYLQVEITARNVAGENVPALQETIHTALAQLAERGLDREMLMASINVMEFAARERDFGSMPKGVVFALQIMDTWLYGGDPAARLCVGDLFDRLRRRAEEGYFEQLLRELLANPHTAAVLMRPSSTCGDDRRRALQERLDTLERSWNPQEREAVARQATGLLEAQQREDTPEQLATLPHLALSDVSEKTQRLLLEKDTVAGRTVLRAPYDTNGIVYADLFFDVSDLTEEELAAAMLLANVLDEMGTERRSSEAFQKQLKTHLGSFTCGVETYGGFDRVDRCMPCFTVRISTLDSKQDKAAELLVELLREATLRDVNKLRQILRQKRLAMREEMTESGTGFAAGRVAAAFSARGVVSEYLSGVEHYRFLGCCAEDTAGTLERLEKLYRRIFTADRLTVSLIGHPAPELPQRLIGSLPADDAAVVPRVYRPLPVAREGIAVPTDVAFTALGGNLYALGRRYSGSMLPAAMLLSYGYFWNVIRVQNGAYGAGLSVGDFGELRCTTYRDPNPANSLDTFRSAAAFLRGNLPEQGELTDLIISAVGESEPLRTPRTSGRMAANRYLLQVDQEHMDRVRAQMLRTTPADVAAFADALEDVCNAAGCCVVGSRELLERCGDRLDTVVELN